MTNTFVVRTAFICIAIIIAFVALTLPAHADHGEEAQESRATTAHSHTTTSHHSEDLAPMQAQITKLKKVVENLLALAHARGIKVDVHVHKETDDHSNEHSHGEMFEAQGDIPTVKVEVYPGVSGYAIFADTEHFTFAPLHADKEHVDNEGHAHIYVDEVKIGRLYAPWSYLPAIEEKGEHTIRIELSTNDHRVYAHDGERIEDIKTIIVE